MIQATFIYEGRSIHNQTGDDLYEFPKKNTEFEIDGKKYFVERFSLLGNTIIYILK